MSSIHDTPNETLQGLEAEARSRFERHFARGRFDILKTAAHIDLPSGERFTVSYGPTSGWSYFYRERAFQMLSVVENRAVCLMALEQRMAVPS